jgi:hypothetical protein
VQIRFPLIDQTNGFRIHEYPGGYEAMRRNQLQPDNYTGDFTHACINTTNGKLRLNTKPTSSEAGRVYNLFYDKDQELCDEDDEVPFSNAAFRAVVPLCSEAFDEMRSNDFNSNEFRKSVGRAVAMIYKVQPRDKW